MRATYDAVATAYADWLAAELDRKPFDRWLLDRVAGLADGNPVVDVGTGPGHVAAHLAAAGADVTGIDLSPGMIDEARRRFPDLSFSVGDLCQPAPAALGRRVGSHHRVVRAGAPGRLRAGPAVASLARVLVPGGWLALSLHAGAEVRHADELWEQPVDIDFVLHDPDDVLAAVRAAGLVDVEWYLRGPYAGAEVETERLYVLGRRPDL